jgi:hypothetical protein
MSKCPFHNSSPADLPHRLRPDLPTPIPERILALPVDERGYPIPFFVGYVDGKPDFRLSDPRKWVACMKSALCWVCGDKLGRNAAFVVGPMCTISRTTAEPPAHLECATWSARACPFLSRPNMVRREDELTQAHEGNVAGEMIKRNPGVTVIWITRSFKPFKDGKGGWLLRMGNPENLLWFREGRAATPEEIHEAFESGLPLLIEKCESDEELQALRQAYLAMRRFLPPFPGAAHGGPADGDN